MFNPPYPRDKKDEIFDLIEELMTIGKTEDFLSEHPGGAFNRKCRHKRAREIGDQLNEIGKYELMEFAYEKIRKKTWQRYRRPPRICLGFNWGMDGLMPFSKCLHRSEIIWNLIPK